MRYIIAIVMALIAQSAASAEVLVGTATLKFQSQPKYQPGSCETRSPAGAEDEVCINMWPWQLHEVVGFLDLKGQAQNVASVVVTAHQPLSGEWLLVVERLSDEEAAKFGAQYKVVDRSRVMRAVCIHGPIEKYTGEGVAPPRIGQADGSYCYDMLAISRK